MNIYFEKTFQRAFGTFPLGGAELANAVTSALEVGYRAFDTAQLYENESDLGEVLAASGIPRSELCITTKVSNENFDRSAFLPSVERSLSDLKVDSVDVLLLHWPPTDGDVAPSLELLQEAFDRGLARNIGVSNYNLNMLRTAIEVLEAPIVTNQVEFHPLLNQDKLLKGAADLGITLSAYCSVARGEVFKYPLLGDIGRLYGKSAAQIVQHWILQKGVATTTMSTNPANIRANFDICDFTLSSVDMQNIDKLTNTGCRIIDSSVSPWAPEWD